MGKPDRGDHPEILTAFCFVLPAPCGNHRDPWEKLPAAEPKPGAAGWRAFKTGQCAPRLGSEEKGQDRIGTDGIRNRNNGRYLLDVEIFTKINHHPLAGFEAPRSGRF